MYWEVKKNRVGGSVLIARTGKFNKNSLRTRFFTGWSPTMSSKDGTKSNISKVCLFQFRALVAVRNDCDLNYTKQSLKFFIFF